MRKIITIFTLISVIAASLVSFFLRTQNVGVVSSFCISPSGYIYYLDGDGRLFCTDKEGNMQWQRKLPREKKDKGYIYSNLSCDENDNIYFLISECNLDEEWKYSVQHYSPEGKYVKTILEYDYIDYSWVITSQYVNGKVATFTQRPGSILELDLYDIKKDLHTKKEYQFEEVPRFHWICYTKWGSIYYTDANHRSTLYCLENSATGEYNTEINLTDRGFPQSIPYNITSDREGNLYFSDICTWRYMVYNEKEDQLSQKYASSDVVMGHYIYDDLLDLKLMYGKHISLLNSNKLNENCIVVQDGDSFYEISELVRPGFVIAIIFISVFLLSMTVLFLARKFIYPLFYAKSILLKQAAVLIALLSVSTVVLSITLNKYIVRRFINETYFQLYTLAANAAEKIDPEQLKKIELPLENENPYYGVLERYVNINLDEFYNTVPKSIQRTLYFNISVCRGNETYTLISVLGDDANRLGGENENYSQSNSMVLEQMKSPDGRMEMKLEQAENGDSLFCTYYIFDTMGKKAGMVEVGVDYRPFSHNLQSMIRKFIFAIIAAMIGIVCILVLMMRKTLGGLSQLRVGVEALAEGNWNAVVDIRSRDEIETIGNAFNHMARKVKNYMDSIEKLNAAYEKFVPRETFLLLDKDSILDVSLGDYTIKDMDVLTINIRNFYELGETMTAAENFNFLNQMYGIWAKAIRSRDGVIEDYRGAGLRAVYGESTDQCIDSVLEILEKLRSAQISVKLNIILQQGMIMFGIAGNSKQTEAVVVSEVLNYTYILEELAQKNDIHLLMTVDAKNKIVHTDKYRYRYIGKVRNSKRLDADIDVYDVINAYPLEEQKNKLMTIEKFHMGVKYYRNGDLEQARNCFVDVIRIDNNDKLAQSYIFLCDKYKNCLPENWTGYCE